jgi:hypothetical protein
MLFHYIRTKEIVKETLRHKVYCQSSQRHRQRDKISSTKNARANNLSFDSRQSNTEEEEEGHIFNEIDQTNIFRESIQKKKKMQTHTQISNYFLRKIHLTC